MHGNQKRTTVCTLRLGKASHLFLLSVKYYSLQCGLQTRVLLIFTWLRDWNFHHFLERLSYSLKKPLALGILRKQASRGEKKCNQKPLNWAADPVTVSVLSWAMFVNSVTHGPLEGWPTKIPEKPTKMFQGPGEEASSSIAKRARTTESHRN